MEAEALAEEASEAEAEAAFNRSPKKGGAPAHRGLADAREGRTTTAMLKHRRGVLTKPGAATPLCPTGYSGSPPFFGDLLSLSPPIWLSPPRRGGY